MYRRYDSYESNEISTLVRNVPLPGKLWKSALRTASMRGFPRGYSKRKVLGFQLAEREGILEAKKEQIIFQGVWTPLPWEFTFAERVKPS
jgi:hypothetical protein